MEDAAKALLEVGSYANYVKAQSETALRRMASVHPYDLVEAEEAVRQGERPTSGTEKPNHDHTPVSTVSLRDGGDAVIEALLHEIRTRMEPIGVSVLEARISHLAYSSEIAGAMLRKQAASAVVAARRMVVKGAVSIVEDALSELDKKKLADALDPERKAAMISKCPRAPAGARYRSVAAEAPRNRRDIGAGRQRFRHDRALSSTTPAGDHLEPADTDNLVIRFACGIETRQNRSPSDWGHLTSACAAKRAVRTPLTFESFSREVHLLA